MQRNEIPLFLHPIRMQFFEYGNVPEKNPTQNVERLLSQNLIYDCRKNARTVEEIAAALGMYPEYIIDELQILTDENGTGYPFVVKTPNGKYRANIILVSVEELDKWEQNIRKDVSKIADDMKRFVENHNIESISREVYSFLLGELQHEILQMLAKQPPFLDIDKSTKEYTCIGILGDEEIFVTEKRNHLQEKCRKEQQKQPEEPQEEQLEKHQQEQQTNKATSCDLLSQLTEQFLTEQQNICEKLAKKLAARLKHMLPKHLASDYEAAAALFLLFDCEIFNHLP